MSDAIESVTYMYWVISKCNLVPKVGLPLQICEDIWDFVSGFLFTMSSSLFGIYLWYPQFQFRVPVTFYLWEYMVVLFAGLSIPPARLLLIPRTIHYGTPFGMTILFRLLKISIFAYTPKQTKYSWAFKSPRLRSRSRDPISSFKSHFYYFIQNNRSWEYDIQTHRLLFTWYYIQTPVLALIGLSLTVFTQTTRSCL